MKTDSQSHRRSHYRIRVQGTTFPTKVGNTMCNALIDTGATRSCMSEKYYKKVAFG